MKDFRFLVIFSLQLSQIEAYCPEKCICLWYIDYTLKINCSRSDKKEVPYGISPQVKVLDLSHNEITYYSHSKYLRAVEEIDLSNNKITQVSFGSSPRHLHSIDLSYNEITHLKKVDVRHLKYLEKLNLSHNSKLHEVSGLKSESLQELDLSHCLISYVDEEFLDGVPNIRSIDLSFNSFRSLNNIRSNSLQNLDVSHLEIEILTHNHVVNLPDLINLNVSFNPNVKIDFSQKNFCWNIKILDLSNSGISSLENMFPFCALEVLNASTNQIEVLPAATFYYAFELIFANLSNNRIWEIDRRAFLKANKLKFLDLSSNRITDLFFTLHLKEVLELDLSSNQIFSMTGLILKKTVVLNLSKNKITQLWINLNEVAPKLKKLNLSHNKIKILNGIASDSLAEVDLSHNVVASINQNAFDDAENIVSINLAGNKLTTLDFRIFNRLDGLKNLSLFLNPWSCLCQSQHFKELYNYLVINRQLGDYGELKCVRTNETWKDSCQDNWRQEREWKKTIYNLTISLIIALLVVGVIFLCKHLNGKKEPEDTETEAEENVEENLSNDRNSLESLRVEEEREEFSERNSTPPPNYEAALLLPKLTEQGGSNELTEAFPSNGGEETPDVDQSEQLTEEER